MDLIITVANATNAFLPLLGTINLVTFNKIADQLGKVINISSLFDIFNTPMNSAYWVAKYALESLTGVCRRELSMYGIQFLTIQTGLFNQTYEIKTWQYGYLSEN